MGKDRLRVLVLAIASILLIAITTLAMDWFTSCHPLADPPPDAALHLDDPKPAKSALPPPVVSGACTNNGFGLGNAPKGAGMFESAASGTLYGCLLYALLVAWQAGTYLLSGVTNARFTKMGYVVGVSMFGSVAMSAYLLQPDGVDRTWAALLLLIGCGMGIAMNYFTVTGGGDAVDGVGEYKPIVIAGKQQPAVVVAPVAPVAPVAATEIAMPVLVMPAAVAVAPVAGVRFAISTAELSRAGIDARRDDGRAVLVMWPDVVGVVARRLPAAAPFNGAAFVDIVSTAGATLRVVPWTRLAGDALAQGRDRVRAIVSYVQTHAPAARLDAATRTFMDVDGSEGPLQLPDGAALAAHDERIG